MARSGRVWFAARVLGLALFAGLSGGCALSRAAGRSAGAFFSSPRKVSKLKDPIDKSARLALVWVGHATVLVQMDDKVILTDPVFTSTVGQVSKRLVEPGVEAQNLPTLDAVLISHMHFDHLSLGSLSAIEKKARMVLMPPKGVTYLTDFSFPVIELAPWQSWEKDGVRVTAVPVDHVGYRYGIDDSWMPDAFTGYVVEYHGLTVYFGGDTAYDQRMFAETAQRFPNVDLALLPIAPIEPREMMRRFHMDPGEALQAFFDLGARWMVPIHYDTFVNATDSPGDALRLLAVAQKKWSMGPRRVVPVAVGERRVLLKRGEESTPRERDASEPAPVPTKALKPPAIPVDDALD